MSDPALPLVLTTRTPPKRKARQLAKHLRGENPDYAYLKAVFRHLRTELEVEVQREPKRLAYVPTETEILRYYEEVWTGRGGQDIVLIKTLLFTGVRVSELVRIRLAEVDLDACRMRITQGKGPRTPPCPSPPRSRRPSRCTWTPNGPRGPTSCSSRAGRSHTRPGGCERSWPGTRPKPVSSTTCLPTGCGISCSPG